MLQTQGLAYSYGNSEQLHFPDIECKSGEHWLLLGQSGSGKTTLLHLLGGLRSPKNTNLDFLQAVKGQDLG